MPTRLPRALPVPPVARRAGACMQRTVRRRKRETPGRLGVLRPWTMRRLPAALDPTSWPVSGLTNTPLRLPGCAASSGGRPHAAGMRRSGAASCRARRVRLPLRGQHRLARLRCRQVPVSRLTARTGAARASTKTRASVGGRAGSVKTTAREPVRARVAAGFPVQRLSRFPATAPRSRGAALRRYRDARNTSPAHGPTARGCRACPPAHGSRRPRRPDRPRVGGQSPGSPE